MEILALPFSKDGYAGPDVCVQGFCLIMNTEGDPEAIRTTKGVITAVDGAVTWDSDNSTADRRLVVSCDGPQKDCVGLDDMEEFQGPAPLEFELTDLRIANGTAVLFKVHIVDPTPDPIIFEVDGTFAFELNGILTVETLGQPDLE